MPIPIPIPIVQDSRADQVTVADLLSIVLGEATKGNIGKSTELAVLAATEDPAATCAAADTAG